MTLLAAELRAHPRHPCDAIRRFEVAIERTALPAAFRVHYRIEGEVDRLWLPAPGRARRYDGLWQHSCFEAFLRPDASDSYHEFNFAPSGNWAAYRFGGRRSERSSPELPAPTIHVARHPDCFELTADIAIAAIPELARAGVIHAGLTAVIESSAGELSYWAAAHGGLDPDFHDPATFLLSAALR